MSPTQPRLADFTTLRVGGSAEHFVLAESAEQVVAAVRAADRIGRPVLLLGGGSNLLVADDGFTGTAIAVRSRGVHIDSDPDGATLRVAAGENWDDLVSASLDWGLSGLEALAGIPGCVGATPIQNVGAYGQEVSKVVQRVSVWDRVRLSEAWLSAQDCGFGYRSSVFKRHPGRYVVNEVQLRLSRSPLSTPVGYAELASNLGVEIGQRAPAVEVRRAVLALRAAKGMVLDPDDHDTWSAGSFFTNPLLSADQAAKLPGAAPRFASADGLVKTSAAWLIEFSGFRKGHGTATAALSGKHVLALTNRGRATAADLVSLAREIREGVFAKTGVLLVPEPVLVGCSL